MNELLLERPMRLITERSSAEKWADFSGDYNVIHFDSEMARKIGASGPVVHGMLALLYIKQAAEIELDKFQPRHMWRRFNALFRNPIPQGTTVALDIVNKTDGVGFLLNQEDSACFKGTHGVTTPLSPDENKPEPTVVDADYARDQYDKFRKNFPLITDSWIFLDGFVFSEFFRGEFPKLAAQQNEKLTVQISHRVSFSPELLQSAFSSEKPFPRIAYTVKSPDVISQESSEFGVFEVDVIVANQFAMRVEIGLLVKHIV